MGAWSPPCDIWGGHGPHGPMVPTPMTIVHCLWYWATHIVYHYGFTLAAMHLWVIRCTGFCRMVVMQMPFDSRMWLISELWTHSLSRAYSIKYKVEVQRRVVSQMMFTTTIVQNSVHVCMQHQIHTRALCSNTWISDHLKFTMLVAIYIFILCYLKVNHWQ